MRSFRNRCFGRLRRSRRHVPVVAALEERRLPSLAPVGAVLSDPAATVAVGAAWRPFQPLVPVTPHVVGFGPLGEPILAPGAWPSGVAPPLELPLEAAPAPGEVFDPGGAFVPPPVVVPPLAVFTPPPTAVVPNPAGGPVENPYRPGTMWFPTEVWQPFIPLVTPLDQPSFLKPPQVPPVPPAILNPPGAVVHPPGSPPDPATGYWPQLAIDHGWRPPPGFNYGQLAG